MTADRISVGELQERLAAARPVTDNRCAVA